MHARLPVINEGALPAGNGTAILFVLLVLLFLVLLLNGGACLFLGRRSIFFELSIVSGDVLFIIFLLFLASSLDTNRTRWMRVDGGRGRSLDFGLVKVAVILIIILVILVLSIVLLLTTDKPWWSAGGPRAQTRTYARTPSSPNNSAVKFEPPCGY